METFSVSQLNDHNGQADKPSYVAYNGMVYDVSASKLWKDGRHMRRHEAGQDLTADILAAPHSPDRLLNFPQVGVLEKKSTVQTRPGRLAWLMEANPFLRRHPHPMTVHFPIAFMIANPFFNLLFWISGRSGFEAAAFHCLWLGAVSMAAAMTTGYMTWWYNYQAKMMSAVAIKITFSTIALIIAGLLIGWHLRLGSPDRIHPVYLALSISLAPLISVVGWFGATLTFPLEKK